MNALANDQLDRMRRMLVDSPEVTFGRYTGDTPGACANDEEKKRAGAITNERYTREEMREAPPHILLTNFAMLEYLLLRPRDADLFNEHHLRYLVLDEAHTYGGAQGIEIALLMRRLKEYLGLAPDRLQFLLTSATIGGPESTDEVIRFAHDLTGQTFELGDVLRGETVTSFDKQLSPTPSLQTLREIVPDGDAFEKWTTAVDDVVKLHSLLEIAGLQPGPLGARVAHRLLYDVFSRSKILADLHALCQAHALSFADICQALGLPDDEASHRGVSWLIALGAHARYGPESAPLLPTRSHFFCRGLAGATVCLNEACGGKSRDADRRWSAFFLEDRKQCGHCESSVLPLCTCVHCGMPVARVRVRDGKWSAGADDLFNQSLPVLLTWLGDLDEDEDEDEQTNADDGPVPSDNSTALLCLTCHAFSEDAQTITCCTTPSLRRLQRLHPSDDQGNLARCPRCAGGSGSFPTVLRTFVTGDDAPAAVLTETLMRHLPRNESMLNGNRLPAHGRNLLVFSDSRQRAAFFAPYLSQTMAETAFLGPIEQALRKAEAREDRATTM
jgi:hypothetical protein